MNAKFTRQLIWEAFYELSAQVPFEKLTVEKIVKQAGVSKATFYRHFRDKYDVLNYNALAIAERLLDCQSCRGWQDFLLGMFKEFERESDYYRRVFKIDGQNAHSAFLFEYSFEFVKKCFLQTNDKEKLTQEEYYMIAHYCHGCVECVADWLRDPSRPSAEQMAALCYRVMPENLRETWIVK